MKMISPLSIVLITILTSCPKDIGSTPDALQGSIAGSVLLPGYLGSANVQDSQRKIQALNSNTATQAIDGEFLITFKNGIISQKLEKLSVFIGSNEVLVDRILWSPAVGIGLYEIRNKNNIASKQIAAALLDIENVASVNPNYIAEPYARPNDPLFPLQWHYESMNLPRAWDVSTGSNTIVAVVDSGIAPNDDLISKTLPGIDMIRDPSNGDGDGIDNNPRDTGSEGLHGTHVSGTIGAASNNGRGVAGVSWGARILPVRVLTDKGGTAADILFGILWAAGDSIQNIPINRNPAKIINLSLGIKNLSCTKDFNDVLNYVTSKNIVVVAAAGNDKVDAASSTPASCPQPIVVAASSLSGSLAPYSNYGTRIDITAPGGNINEVFGNSCQGPCAAGVLSTDYNSQSNRSTTSIMQGTSMAAPHVTGAVALYLSVFPTATPSQVRSEIRKAARPLPKGCDRACGAGLLDVAALLTRTEQIIPTLPPTRNATLYIAALYQVGTQLDPTRSSMVSRNDSRLIQPYVMQYLSFGTYVMAAWVDSDGDQTLDDSEPFGFYGTPIKIDSNKRNFDNVVFSMKASSITGQSALNKEGIADVVKIIVRQQAIK